MTAATGRARVPEPLRVRGAIAAAIRERMGLLGLNAKRLSEASSVSASSVSNYLREERDVPQPQLFAIAAALKVRPSALLDRAVEILDLEERGSTGGAERLG